MFSSCSERLRGAVAALLLIALAWTAPALAAPWRALDVRGSSPRLAFTLTRASDGKAVTAADYRGDVVLLYFGYTFCPDVCPTTLMDLSRILDRLGPERRRVRVLFVTVDPARDTLAALKDYVKSFAPEIEGLRGTPDQLAALARRYRVVYSVKPAEDGKGFDVSHSASIYVFDGAGAARLLMPPLTTADPAGPVADLKRLIEGKPRRGSFLAALWDWL